jgi:hypothetical protein
MRPAWKRLLELTGPYRLAFEEACASPQIAQERFLLRALAANTDTDIGRRLDFRTITTAAAYAGRVPIVRFGDIETELAAWRDGKATLCGEAVVHTEWTSGSTREAKAIPYGEAGLEGFRHALLPWLSDLCNHVPAIAAGHVYWALSPAGTSAFDNRRAGNDAAYFGQAAPLLQDLSAVPLQLAELADAESWRFWTALFLAACEDLSFISIWSPTFLYPLLDTLEQAPDRIADAMLRPERYAAPAGLTPSLRRLQADAHRHAERLRSAMRGGQLDSTVLWPGLRRISCWTHGTAARHIPGLAKRLAGVRIEPKGLLSTEAAVSLPLHEAADPVAAVNSSFLELLYDDGRCLPLREWCEGDEGRMVITTRSGLWRYDTGDRVRISGFWKNTPTLVFVGRDGFFVDLCGEKLDETLVQDRLPSGLDAFVAPDAGNRGYCLFLEAAQVTNEKAMILADQLDSALCDMLHYRHARELGQLTPLRPARVAGLLTSITGRIREMRGTPLATIKLPTLDGDSGWHAYFAHTGVLEMT